MTAARAAQPDWREVPPQQRARAVLALREELLRRRGELTALVSADMGKTLADADGEVGRGIESVESAAAIPHLLKGETLEGVAAGVDVELVRQPVGVVAAITPFNFPAMIPLWFLPYAIACGNTFVLKPSEPDPRPVGADRGDRSTRSRRSRPASSTSSTAPTTRSTALLDHPGIDAISFVGRRRRPGWSPKARRATGKRVQALGGAKNSLVVMPDADLEQRGAGDHGLGLRRRRAALPGRLGLRRRRRREPARGGAPGAGRGGRGAARRARRRPRDRRLPDGLRRRPRADRRGDRPGRGRRRRAAARRPRRRRAGRHPAGPTIAVAADPESELAREELFGPLLTLVEVGDLDAALEFVNGSRYGNAGAIFTRSGEAAREYRYGVEAGMLGVNVGVPAPVAWFPFAGWKDSIDGDLHANGTDAVDFYTRKKVVTTRW